MTKTTDEKFTILATVLRKLEDGQAEDRREIEDLRSRLDQLVNRRGFCGGPLV